MHEASIAESILRIVKDALPQPDAKVLKVTVVAGALSGVEDEPLALWFEQLAKGTAAEGAKLVVKRAPARLKCKSCDWAGDFDGAGPVNPICVKCGAVVSLEGGDELYVENAEVE